MDDMYRELIIEHYKNPSYRGELDPCDHTYEDENPSCGDELRIMLNVDENNIITDARSRKMRQIENNPSVAIAGFVHDGGNWQDPKDMSYVIINV